MRWGRTSCSAVALIRSAGIMNKPVAIPVTHWLIYVRVADIDATIALALHWGPDA